MPLPVPPAVPPPSRLLIPRVRLHDPARLSRTRPTPSSPHDTALQCLGLPLNFDVVQDQLELDGYQMYAVEKWIVERNRPITVLTVYTGDPSHKISVTALAPSTSLSEKDAAAQWEQALLHVRRDANARPKQTPYGIVMATSLAYFRSDYTIVHIPHGNFLLAKDQLYTNINLLRMGYSGRAALTLEEPSDTTKERFISTYHIPEVTLPSTLPFPLYHVSSADHLPFSSPQLLSASSSLASRSLHPSSSPSRRPDHHRTQSQSHSPQKSSLFNTGDSRPGIHVISPTPTSSVKGDSSHVGGSLGASTLALLGTHAKGKSRDPPFFNATVLELVKLVQVGLALFGMYAVTEGSGGSGLLIDGLLCDVTVQGIEKWVTEIGEPRVGLEPFERIADPMFVAALLSLVVSIRNKLSASGLSHLVPKDPFLHPQAFSLAIASHIPPTGPSSSSTTLSPQGSPPSTTSPSTAALTRTYHLPIGPLSTTVTTAPFAAAAFLNSGSSIPSFFSSPHPNSHISSPSGASALPAHSQCQGNALLTRDLVDSIEVAYAKRVASMNESEGATNAISGNPGGGPGSGSTANLGGGNVLGASPGSGAGSQARRKVKRVLKGKLDDLTSAVVDRDYDDGAGDGERTGGALSGGEADGNLSVGSSGGQLFRGMGNLLLSGASGIGSAAGGIMNIWDTTLDLDVFVAAVVEREGKKGGLRGRRKKGGKGSESVDYGNSPLSGLGLGYHGRSNPTLPLSLLNGEHGAIVTMLWSGRVADVVALREWEKEKERIESYMGTVTGGAGLMSDGEEVKSEGIGGRSTEGEESDLQVEGKMGNSFGGVWSGRMQRKLESWTGLSKRKGQSSLDISYLPSITSMGKQGKARQFSLGARSPASKVVDAKELRSRIQSPTLHPTPASGDLEQDEVLLDSGQVSPSSDYRVSPFGLGSPPDAGTSGHLSDRGNPSLFYDASRGVSSVDLGRSGSSKFNMGINSKNHSTDLLTNNIVLGPPFELDTDKTAKSSGRRLGKRPVYQQRVASWSDSRSPRRPEMLALQGRLRRKKGEKVKLRSSGALLDGMAEELEGITESDFPGERGTDNELGGVSKVKALGFRRRSYHDLESLRPAKVLTPERMRTDVELCAQVLIMVRREEHLRNVIACLQTLATTLASTNTQLRDDFETHKDAILEIEGRASVIEDIDMQAAKTDRTTQATNTLQYESAQFSIPELWHTASLSRKKVFELREKVFGEGARRLPPGKHGAHGRFNRVQWTLDGQRRLVDYLGRTEEEAEEESRLDIEGAVVPPPALEEEEVVEHPGIKPMWLLRFFTSWGTRWSTLAGSAPAGNGGGVQEGSSGDKAAAPASLR